MSERPSKYYGHVIDGPLKGQDLISQTPYHKVELLDREQFYPDNTAVIHTVRNTVEYAWHGNEITGQGHWGLI